MIHFYLLFFEGTKFLCTFTHFFLHHFHRYKIKMYFYSLFSSPFSEVQNLDEVLLTFFFTFFGGTKFGSCLCTCSFNFCLKKKKQLHLWTSLTPFNWCWYEFKESTLYFKYQNKVARMFKSKQSSKNVQITTVSDNSQDSSMVITHTAPLFTKNSVHGLHCISFF